MTVIILFLVFISFTFYRTVYKNRKAGFTAFYVLYFLMILSFFGLFISTCIYLSKDNVYSNMIIDFFFIPNIVLKYFMGMPVPKLILVQLINLFSLAFVTSCILFALAYSSQESFYRYWMYIVSLTVVQLILFDPFVYRTLYSFAYPDRMSFLQLGNLTRIIKNFSLVVNSIFLIMSFVLLLIYYFRLPAFRELKNSALFILVFQPSLIVTYFFAFYWSPGYLIKVNKFAETISYLSIPLDYEHITYTFLILFQFVYFVIIAVCLYKQKHFEDQIRENNNSLLRNIDVAKVTSRMFSHYIKNEIYAIQAEISLAAGEAPDIAVYQTTLDAIRTRCSDIAQHLDRIQKRLLFSKLALTPQNLLSLLQEVLTKLQPKLADIKVEVSSPKDDIVILADKDYFEEVLSNILINSVEAMAGVPAASKRIEIRIERFDAWVIIRITDHGTGIESKQIKEAFKPYVSTKPSHKNWGLGLFLCERIISAHDGRIELESVQGSYTTVKILLPYYNGQGEERS